MEKDKQIYFWTHMLDECFYSESSQINEAKMSRSELDDFYDKLRTGIVTFNFIKKDGTSRKAVGTLNPALMPSASEQRAKYDALHNEDPAKN